jgi:peptidoglycan/LPS O-acetylase OafA/YrhL
MFPWLLYRDWRAAESDSMSLWRLACWAVLYLLLGVGLFLVPRLLTVLVAATCLVTGMMLMVRFWDGYGDWRRRREGG